MRKSGPIFEYLESIAEMIPAPFYWLDLKGRAVGCNTLDWKVIGVPNQSYLIGKTPHGYYPKDIAEVLYEDTIKVLQTGKNSQMEDVIVDFTTGKRKYFSAVRSPLRNKNNEIIGVVGTSIEITEEKEAQKSMFNQIRAEQEILKTEVDRFRYESELRRLKCQVLEAEKESQARVTNFVNKMMHEIQTFRIEELHRTTGIRLPINDTGRQIKLTKREQQIIYLLSLNKSPKDIAHIITIIENKPVSNSTINAIINKKLYPKFEVFNIGQLVEKAIMLNQIPFLLDDLGS
ncbi:MAG TPA: PAS domain-containing protein [Aquella sp.]|nr:PAS domain-containing protein [Aquella sp.]